MSAHVRREGGLDPHEVLGVPRGADRQQVMRAFHRRARRGGHPDTGGDAQTFEEIVRARDVLLDRAGQATHEPHARTTPAATAPVATAPRPPARPANSPPKETNGLAIVTAALALLGPLFWPVAIIIGHVALRQIKRTGQGGGAMVPVVLFILYVLTLSVLVRVLSLLFIP